MSLRLWRLATTVRFLWQQGSTVGLAATVIAALLPCPQAFAAAPTIPQIREVKLVEPGRIESFTTTFQILLAPDAKAPTLSFSDWKGPGDAPLRSYPLATSTPSKSQPGLWEIVVTLPSVAAVGTYKGQLSVKSTSPATPPSPEDYNIIFVGSFRPSMTLSQATPVTLKVSNCESPCFLTNLFLPDKADSFGFETRNNSPAAVDITISHVPLGAMPGTPPTVSVEVGKKGSEPTSEPKKGSEPTSELKISSVLPGESAKFSVSVDKVTSLEPAAYLGSLRVSTRPAGSGEAADPAPVKQADGTFAVGNATVNEIQLAVHVRSPVIYALMVCFLGVAVGRVVSTLASPGFDTKLKYFPEYRALYNSFTQLPQALMQLSVTATNGAELADAMKERLDALWRKMLDGTESTPATAFEALRNHNGLILKWGNLHHTIAANPKLQHQTLDKSDGLRKRLLAPLANVVEFEKDLDVLRAEVDSAIASQRLAEIGVKSEVGGNFKKGKVTNPDAPEGRWASIACVFDFLAGTGTAGVKFYYDFGRPIVHIVLLTTMVIYGVWINYSTGASASTFGSVRLGDYAALFLWGITADIISKGFQGITFRRP
jgi:hypothetical protein